MRINELSLNTKILVFVSSILILVTLLVTVTTLQSAYSHADKQLAENFHTSKQVFLYKLKNDADVLLGSLENAGKNFSVKKLIAGAQKDPKSLQSALLNLQHRASADFSMVLDAKSTLLAANAPEMGEIDPQSFNGSELTFLTVDDKVYLVKSYAVKYLERQPTIDAWLLMGIDLDRIVNDELADLTGFKIQFFHQQISMTDADINNKEFLDINLVADQLVTNKGVKVSSDGVSYILYRFFANEKQEGLSFIFKIESESAFLNYSNLTVKVVAELFFAIAVAVLLSFYLSKTITKPLRSLAVVARRIRQGDYFSPIPSFGTIEIKNLSLAFSEMQSSIKNREEEINKLAYFDSLTHLPNRNNFVKQLNSSIEKSPEESLIIATLDIDRFKEINDTIGREFGDKLLQEVALRLESVYIENSIHARVGGDEFSILIPRKNGREVISIMNQYVALFDVPFNIDDIVLEINVSFGIALFPNHGESAYKVMQCADISLYKCKESHAPYVFYRDEYDTFSLQRLKLMSDLRHAIHSGEIKLFYQPKLCLKTKKIISVECLVRWMHPEYGFINPDDFIPLAEQSGTIRSLTQWVITTALKQHVQWRSAGIPLNFAVNISALDLVDLSLPSFVSQQLSEHQVESSCLTLEVTESAVMNDPDAAIKALDMLRRMGIKLSIDDFGTGYSSMAYLKQMPVSELKIDKAFVLELANNIADQNIVKYTVFLAHSMGLNVVAEGVEDEKALALLDSLGVENAQGYFIARPMPCVEFEAWIMKSQYWGASHANVR